MTTDIAENFRDDSRNSQSKTPYTIDTIWRSATMSKPFAIFKACRSQVTDCYAKIRRCELSAYNLKAAFNLCLSPPQRPLRVVGRLGRGKKRKRVGDDGKGKGSHEKGNQLKHIRHFVNFTKWRMEVKRMRLSSSIFRKCGAILNALYESRAQSSPARKLFLGTLRSEDDNGGENVA